MGCLDPHDDHTQLQDIRQVKRPGVTEERHFGILIYYCSEIHNGFRTKIPGVPFSLIVWENGNDWLSENRIDFPILGLSVLESSEGTTPETPENIFYVDTRPQRS